MEQDALKIVLSFIVNPFIEINGFSGNRMGCSGKESAQDNGQSIVIIRKQFIWAPRKHEI